MSYSATSAMGFSRLRSRRNEFAYFTVFSGDSVQNDALPSLSWQLIA